MAFIGKDGPVTARRYAAEYLADKLVAAVSNFKDPSLTAKQTKSVQAHVEKYLARLLKTLRVDPASASVGEVADEVISDSVSL